MSTFHCLHVKCFNKVNLLSDTDKKFQVVQDPAFCSLPFIFALHSGITWCFPVTHRLDYGTGLLESAIPQKNTALTKCILTTKTHAMNVRSLMCSAHFTSSLLDVESCGTFSASAFEAVIFRGPKFLKDPGSHTTQQVHFSGTVSFLYQ